MNIHLYTYVVCVSMCMRWMSWKDIKGVSIGWRGTRQVCSMQHATCHMQYAQMHMCTCDIHGYDLNHIAVTLSRIHHLHHAMCHVTCIIQAPCSPPAPTTVKSVYGPTHIQHTHVCTHYAHIMPPIYLVSRLHWTIRQCCLVSACACVMCMHMICMRAMLIRRVSRTWYVCMSSCVARVHVHRWYGL